MCRITLPEAVTRLLKSSRSSKRHLTTWKAWFSKSTPDNSNWCKRTWHKSQYWPQLTHLVCSQQSKLSQPSSLVQSQIKWSTLMSVLSIQERLIHLKLLLCNSKYWRKMCRSIQTRWGVLPLEIKQGAQVERPLDRTRRRRVRNDRGGWTNIKENSLAPNSRTRRPPYQVSSSNSLRRVVWCQLMGCLSLQRTPYQAKAHSK